jgi:uncharacterized protein YjgD (DUF1641 family)
MATETLARSRKRGHEQTNSTEFPSPRMLELMSALEKRGLMEAATGALNDEATFSGLMSVVSSDDALSIIQNAKRIIKLLSAIDYDALNELAQALSWEKQALSGAKSLVRLMSALESRGLIEPIVGLLNDEKTFANLAKLLSDDSMLTVIDNMPKLAKLASVLDPQVLDLLSKVVSSLKTEVKPVKGFIADWRELSEPAVAAGIGKVFEILRVLGESVASKES